jgi:hypothetical protein
VGHFRFFANHKFIVHHSLLYNHEPVRRSTVCVVSVSRLQDIQWRMDTVVVDKNQMAGELRVGLRVFHPASGTHCTHNFNISSQQVHLLLAGECLVGPIRNVSPSSLQVYVSAALELSYSELCSTCDGCNTAEDMLTFFPLFYFEFCCKNIPFYIDIRWKFFSYFEFCFKNIPFYLDIRWKFFS